jgi:hypothetical protein
MAFESEQGNFVGPTDEVSDAMAAALVQKIMMVPLIYSEDIPAETNVKVFKQDGKVEAVTLAESAPYTFNADSEIVQSSFTATATKKVVGSKLTVEAGRYRGEDEISVATRQGEGIGRALDNEIFALFGSFANSVGATGTALAGATILDAAFTVKEALAAGEQRLRGVFDYKGLNELKTEVNASGSALYGNDAMSSFVTDLFQSNTDTPRGFVTHFGGVDLYESAGVTDDGTDDTGLVFNPEMAIAGIYDPSISVWMLPKGSEGLYTEIMSWTFSDAIEWVDLAGCRVISAT